MPGTAALNALTFRMLIENGLVSRDVVRLSLTALRDGADPDTAAEIEIMLATLQGVSDPVGGARVPDAVQISGLESFVDRMAANLAGQCGPADGAEARPSGGMKSIA